MRADIREAFARARRDWFLILMILVALGVGWLFLYDFAPSLVR